MGARRRHTQTWGAKRRHVLLTTLMEVKSKQAKKFGLNLFRFDLKEVQWNVKEEADQLYHLM